MDLYMRLDRVSSKPITEVMRLIKEVLMLNPRPFSISILWFIIKHRWEVLQCRSLITSTHFKLLINVNNKIRSTLGSINPFFYTYALEFKHDTVSMFGVSEPARNPQSTPHELRVTSTGVVQVPVTTFCADSIITSIMAYKPNGEHVRFRLGGEQIDFPDEIIMSSIDTKIKPFFYYRNENINDIIDLINKLCK